MGLEPTTFCMAQLYRASAATTVHGWKAALSRQF